MITTPEAASLTDGAQRVAVRGLRGGVLFEGTDAVVDEVPVALEFNGLSHAVMLATPTDLEDFALGFALSESIVEHAGQVYGVEQESSDLGVTLRVEVASAAFSRLKLRRRTLAGRTGCGLCGAESLAELMPPVQPVLASVRISTDAVHHAVQGLAAAQRLQGVTGAAHAAAWCSERGDIEVLREDVGRHNALDKLVGALRRNEQFEGAGGFVLVTSRASFEMVNKAAAALSSVLVAVSAPTALAIRTAERLGVCLAGFARKGDIVVYSHPDLLCLAPGTGALS